MIKSIYEPIELESEKMVKMARDHTENFIEYVISDSVTIFNLEMKHIHDFTLPCRHEGEQLEHHQGLDGHDV